VISDKQAQEVIAQVHKLESIDNIKTLVERVALY